MNGQNISSNKSGISGVQKNRASALQLLFVMYNCLFFAYIEDTTRTNNAFTQQPPPPPALIPLRNQIRGFDFEVCRQKVHRRTTFFNTKSHLFQSTKKLQNNKGDHYDKEASDDRLPNGMCSSLYQSGWLKIQQLWRFHVLCNLLPWDIRSRSYN